MDKYEPVREIGAGNFGVAKLMRNKETRELVAMKFIERGYRVGTYQLDPCLRSFVPSLSFLQGFAQELCDDDLPLPDRRERVPRDREPPVAPAPEHHPVQGGGGDADAPGDRDGVRGGRGAVRAHLRGREVPRGRGEVLLPAAGVRRQLLPRHADLPPRPQAGEHAARRQPRAEAQDLRLRLLQVLAAALAPQVNGRHPRLHRPRGALQARVRRQARRRLVLRRHALRHARRRLPLRGSQGPQELPKDHLEDHVGAVQDTRVRARLPELPPPPLPHLRRKPAQEDHDGRDQEPPVVPQEPAAGAQRGGPGSLLQPPRRRRRRRRRSQRQWYYECKCQWYYKCKCRAGAAHAHVLGAERGGHHEDRSGGSDGAQARQARLRLRLGHRRVVGRRARQPRGRG